jgi:hypothetical protein
MGGDDPPPPPQAVTAKTEPNAIPEHVKTGRQFMVFILVK